MKSRNLSATCLTTFTLAFALPLAASAYPCEPGAKEVCIYKDANYGGAWRRLQLGDYPVLPSSDNGTLLANDSISSFIVGSGVVFRICGDSNFNESGPCDDWTGMSPYHSYPGADWWGGQTGCYNQGNTVCNDWASSLRVMDCQNPGPDQCSFFSDGWFLMPAGAECAVLNKGAYPNHQAFGIRNDWLSSFKCGSGAHATIYRHDNYNDPMYSSNYAPELGSFNDETSSVYVW